MFCHVQESSNRSMHQVHWFNDVGLKMESIALLIMKTCVLIMIASESDSCCRKVAWCFELCTVNHGMHLLELTGYSCQHTPTQGGAHLLCSLWPFHVRVGVPCYL